LGTGWESEGEGEVLGLGFDGRRRGDGERLEDLEADGGEVGAGTRYYEALEGGECELAGGGGEEGEGGGLFVEESAVVAVLFAFLADDRGHAADEAAVAVGSEERGDVLQGAEDDVGEGGGQGDGFLEVGDGEVVLAGLDDGVGSEEVLEGAVGVEGVEFFLRLDGREGFEDEVTFFVVVDLKLVVFPARDVGDEFGEERYFEELVEGDESQTREGIGGGRGRGRFSVWKTAMSCDFDGRHVAGGWEAIP